MIRRNLLLAGGALAVIALLGFGAAYAYFFSGLRSAPPPLALATPTPGASASAVPAGELAGIWTVASGSQAEYRVNEVFAGQTSSHQAVARTSALSGGLTVAGLQVSNLTFTAQLASLTSVDTVSGYQVSNRDRLVQQSLQTSQFPDAVFKAASFTLPTDVTAGQQVQVVVPGQLTIHGVTRDVTASVTLQVAGGQVQALGIVNTDMATFNITPPRAPFTTVDQKVEIDVKLNFSRA
ncbi:MAG: YceI family protein [Chloroflexota bacterium]